MNRPVLPPERCDILVIGAGPAGSACALGLARAGFDVVLADQHDFPRDKTCGDGLIPDAHAALQRLGVYDAVMRAAHPLTHVRCISPLGAQADVPGTLAVLPRRQLDHLLVQAAQGAGARLVTPWRFERTLVDGQGRVAGACLRRKGAKADDTVSMAARQVVLATGAPAQGLVAAGLCQRQTPSSMGLRGYVHHPGLAERLPHLLVAWHSRLTPGYGWIFPCGRDLYNIGVGLVDSHRSSDGRKQPFNLREMFDAFVEVHAPARELMAGGTLQGRLEGAPLRCSLTGAELCKPGILVTGEAAGSTYAFTGEGIGKALETGLLAAEALIAARDHGLDDEALAQHYRTAIDRLRPKYSLYEKGNRVNRHPWLTELLVRRARHSERLRGRMAEVLEEKSTPDRLLTLRGMFKMLVQ